MRTTKQGMPYLMIVAAIGLMAGCVSAASRPKPLKVFILAGQSNMQGHANVSTFDSMASNPKTAPLLKEMRNADGTPRVCERVWISSIGCAGNDVNEQTGKVTVGFGASAAKIGPEFTFGLTLEKRLKEPILLIKTAWGGKSLNTDFRPPSAGPYVFNETQLAAFGKDDKALEAMKAAKAKETGVYYRMMVEHVRKVLADIKRVVPEYDPAQGYEIAGFVWFQGWNDFVDSNTYPKRNQPGGYDLYEELLCHFIRDVRKDLGAPEMPFVIGVMGIGGPTTEAEEAAKPPRYRGIVPNFRKAMAAPAAMPEFKGTVTAVLTENYWDRELDELVARKEKIGERAKKLKDEGKLSPDEQKAALEKFKAELFTAREAELLAKGVSNGGYHYLGAARIMAPIGKAFGEAMADLQRANDRRTHEQRKTNMSSIENVIVAAKSLKEMQEEFLKLKFGMFIHYNLETYKGVQWVSGYHSPADFNPGGPVDTDAWADAAKSAGMKYAVLTVKHVSGFCLWDSQYTTYDVMSPDCPYKQDLVAQFIKSFTSRGLKVGLYYCWRHPGFKAEYKVLPPECDPATHSMAEQIEFQKKQIAELVEKYPQAFYIWNDALDPDIMPAEQATAFVRSLRPGVLACGNWWDWKKKGMPYLDLSVTETRHFPETHVGPGETCWCLENSWFHDGTGPKTAADIVRQLQTANSHNANFLLNVGPNKQGKFQEASIKVLAEVGKLLNQDAAGK